MDYLTVDALKINASHGHYEHERKTEQEFEISLRVGFINARAGETDVLADTIDYDDLRKIVLVAFSGTQRYLVEKLAESIADEILKDIRAKEVTVSIRKTAAWSDGIPGIQITRKRP